MNIQRDSSSCAIAERLSSDDASKRNTSKITTLASYERASVNVLTAVYTVNLFAKRESVVKVKVEKFLSSSHRHLPSIQTKNTMPTTSKYFFIITSKSLSVEPRPIRVSGNPVRRT